MKVLRVLGIVLGSILLLLVMICASAFALAVRWFGDDDAERQL